ncbi:VOC family protein [Actinomadura chibensis]|uniref:Glyoxalase/bleomycin resistance/dioxygenase family protein n=1 Tax=Actinomadura chibensis TaxID=392828 RepID=A0A5D0NWZ2_9ACTN|nr:VOC family protein [Actinomadura chibensis]TYB48792.1 glyoxalase/bleomycin resistance/dioxygenase family protein [Actinomadura chibensis]
MNDAPRMTLSAPVLDAPDPHALADFYQRLLGWKVVQDESDWVKLRPPSGGTGLSFQTEPIHAAPTWPAVAGEQQIQAHLDFEVEDLDRAGAHAEAMGAVLADWQPDDEVRVYLDPVGHPFCLFLPEPEAPLEP